MSSHALEGITFPHGQSLANLAKADVNAAIFNGKMGSECTEAQNITSPSRNVPRSGTASYAELDSCLPFSNMRNQVNSRLLAAAPANRKVANANSSVGMHMPMNGLPLSTSFQSMRESFPAQSGDISNIAFRMRSRDSSITGTETALPEAPRCFQNASLSANSGGTAELPSASWINPLTEDVLNRPASLLLGFSSDPTETHAVGMTGNVAALLDGPLSFGPSSVEAFMQQNSAHNSRIDNMFQPNAFQSGGATLTDISEAMPDELAYIDPCSGAPHVYTHSDPLACDLGMDGFRLTEACFSNEHDMEAEHATARPDYLFDTYEFW
jgi:hypothetical protein